MAIGNVPDNLAKVHGVSRRGLKAVIRLWHAIGGLGECVPDRGPLLPSSELSGSCADATVELRIAAIKIVGVFIEIAFPCTLIDPSFYRN